MTSAPSVRKIFPPAHQTIDKEHGRLEIRTLCASSFLKDYLNFPHCGQVFKIIRERTILTTGKTSSETVYGITSLTARQADAERLLTLSRGHWSIENRSHYVRDMLFDEDRHQLRKGKGPQMMACLRNFAISLLRMMNFKNITKATREFAARTHLTLRLLGL
jgi:hypothetical protein